MNQEKRSFEVFAQPGFIVALALLLVNDLYFKVHYANWLTGKLSDFAGLYVFAQFVAVCFGVRIVSTAVATAALFMIWKSPLATPMIEFVNQYFVVQIHRTIDYTDLLAIAILPLAVKCYDAGSTWPWSFIKYPAAVLALLGIMATSALQPYYNVRMDLGEIPNREGDISTTYANVDKLLITRGMQCVACPEGSSYREYLNSNESIRIRLNYDDVGQKLFVSLYTSSPDTSQWRIDELRTALMEVLRLRFEDITVVRAASPHSVNELKKSSWELKIRAPSVGFPLSCTGNGRNHPGIAKAIAIIDRALDVPSAMVFPYSSCNTNDDRCSVSFCRDIVFGRVAGPDRFDKSIHARTQGYFGFEGTTLYVELIEIGDDQSQGANFMDDLERQLRATLASNISITLTKSRATATH